MRLFNPSSLQKIPYDVNEFDSPTNYKRNVPIVSPGSKKVRPQQLTTARKSSKIEAEDVSVPSNFEHLAHIEKDSNENNFILPKAQNDVSVRNIFLMINQSIDEAVRFPKPTELSNSVDNAYEGCANLGSPSAWNKLSGPTNTSKRNGTAFESSECMYNSSIPRPTLKPERIFMNTNNQVDQYSKMALEPEELPLPRRKYLSYIQNSDLAYSPMTPLDEQFSNYGQCNSKCPEYGNAEKRDVLNADILSPAAEDFEKVFNDFDRVLNEQDDTLSVHPEALLEPTNSFKSCEQLGNDTEKKGVKELAELLHKSIYNSTRRQRAAFQNELSNNESTSSEALKSDNLCNENMPESHSNRKELKLVNIYGLGDSKTISEIIASKKRDKTKPSPPPATAKPKLRLVDVDNQLNGYDDIQTDDAEAVNAIDYFDTDTSDEPLAKGSSNLKNFSTQGQDLGNEHKILYFKSSEYDRSTKNKASKNDYQPEQLNVSSPTVCVSRNAFSPKINTNPEMSNEKRKKDSGYNSPTNDMQIKAVEKNFEECAEEHTYSNLPCCGTSSDVQTKRFLDNAKAYRITPNALEKKPNQELKCKDNTAFCGYESKTNLNNSLSLNTTNMDYDIIIGKGCHLKSDIDSSKMFLEKPGTSAGAQPSDLTMLESSDVCDAVKWRGITDSDEIVSSDPMDVCVEQKTAKQQNILSNNSSGFNDSNLELQSDSAENSQESLKQPQETRKKPIPKPRSRPIQSASSPQKAFPNENVRFRDVRSMSANHLERISERSELTSFLDSKTTPAPPAPPPRPSLKNGSGADSSEAEE
uniref:CRIB domain-containing protein n=1 Tax=Syphacia muris TaxID=451379 RepID=A0A0N5ANC2_9BILA